MSIAFRQAKYFTKGRIAPVRLIVIHDMEWAEQPETAEACAAMFAGANSPKASTHYSIDSNSEVQSVRDEDTAWCAPGANADGLHFEHAGFARQTAAEWADAYSVAMLRRSAKLTAAKAKKFGIPVRRLTVEQIRAGYKGFAGHLDITNALNGGKGHWDPGYNFPWDWYLGLVREELAALNKGVVAKIKNVVSKTPGPLKVDGSLGPNTVAALQRALKKKGYEIVVDSKIDADDSLMVRALQMYLNRKGARDNRGARLKVDGKGLQPNTSARYPRVGTTRTLYALSGYVRNRKYGWLNAFESATVKALQKRLNAGTF